MAGNLKEKAGSTTTCAASGSTANLSSGTAVAATAGGGNLTNSSNLDNVVTAVLTGAAGSTPTQGTTVSLYLVPKADGSNVATVDTSTPWFSPNYFAGYFYWPYASSASSAVMDITNIPLEAYDYEPFLVNNLGQTLSSGWQLIFYGTQGQYT